MTEIDFPGRLSTKDRPHLAPRRSRRVVVRNLGLAYLTEDDVDHGIARGRTTVCDPSPST
jgi:hypothetical protein